MTVYVLINAFGWDYEGYETSIVGVYSSKEKALEAMQKGLDGRTADNDCGKYYYQPKSRLTEGDHAYYAIETRELDLV